MMQIPDLAATFLDARQHTFLANTRRAYRSDLAIFARSIPGLDATAVTADHLRAFLAATADRAPSTVARRRAALRSCFSWAYRNGVVPTDPTTHLDKITLPQREPRPLERAEVDALLAAIPARHACNRLLFTLLYETGLRVGEALALHSTDVHLNDLDGGYLRVVGKGDRERSVPLIDAPRSVRLLRPLTEKRRRLGPLFHGDVAKGGSYSTPLEYTTVFYHYHFERYVAAARRATPAAFADDPDPVTIHRLRHTFASERLHAGVSLAAMRKLLGHQNLQTTLRYAEIDLEAVKHELVEARRRTAGW